MDISIELAAPADAAAILALQYLAYQSEALLYDDPAIPPLTQTLASLEAEFATLTILVARAAGEIVGSVRARRQGATCEIGRLIVLPRRQRQGIGSRLMTAIEARFADVARYELFTGHRSEGNLRLYRRLGYREFRRERVAPHLEMVYLEKPR